MPDWMIGLNMAFFTVPLLLGSVAIICVVCYLDWRNK
jgi:hypothetical protein